MATFVESKAHWKRTIAARSVHAPKNFLVKGVTSVTALKRLKLSAIIKRNRKRTLSLGKRELSIGKHILGQKCLEETDRTQEGHKGHPVLEVVGQHCFFPALSSSDSASWNQLISGHKKKRRKVKKQRE